MRYKRINSGLLLAAATALSVFTVGTVSAEPGSGLRESGGSPGSGYGRDARVNQAVSAENNDPTTSSTGDFAAETEQDKITTNVEDLRERAKKAVELSRAEKVREKKQEQNAENRQKACMAREARLNTKIAGYGKQAKRHLEAYDKTLAKLQAFQADKKLPAADYESLATAAETKKAEALEAVNALLAVSVKIDCTATDSATAVATVKTAVVNAKQALKDYRAAVKNVLVELMTSKSGTKSDTLNTDGSADNAEPAPKPQETNL